METHLQAMLPRALSTSASEEKGRVTCGGLGLSLAPLLPFDRGSGFALPELSEAIRAEILAVARAASR